MEQSAFPSGDVRELVKAAFDAARQSGKDDWHRMTSAVLKNRLLQLTDGRFREADYGMSTLSEFLASLEDLLEVDRSSFPPLVVLKGISASQARPSQEAGRIRSDLWAAAMDYSSATKYIWDETERKARQGRAQDGPVIPTVTKNELASWRREFVDSQAGAVADEEADQLTKWGEQGLGTEGLPGRLRPAWNGFVKERVLRRLEQWFAEKELTPPRDLLVRAERHDEHATELASLRRAVIEAVYEMTLGELKSLQVPASVLTRRRRGGPR